MQTFLPEHNFVASARALKSGHRGHLLSQMNEGARIMTALVTGKGWIHHPATKMWAGHESALLDYLVAIKRECKARHIDYTAHWDAIQLVTGWSPDSKYERVIRGGMPPEWWVDDDTRLRIVTTHRARLYQKDPVAYARYKDEAISYVKTLDTDPTALVCCATRRAGGPCQYYWPTHKE